MGQLHRFMLRHIHMPAVRHVVSASVNTRMDGELVALYSAENPSFSIIQNYVASGATFVSSPSSFCSMRNKISLARPLAERRELLRSSLGPNDSVELSESLPGCANRVALMYRWSGSAGAFHRLPASSFCRVNAMLRPGHGVSKSLYTGSPEMKLGCLRVSLRIRQKPIPKRHRDRFSPVRYCELLHDVVDIVADRVVAEVQSRADLLVR